MQRFLECLRFLKSTRSESQRVTVLQKYFEQVTSDEGAAALWLLLKPKLRRLATRPQLREWSCTLAGIPQWLFDASLKESGDFAETAGLIIPDTGNSDELELSECVSLISEILPKSKGTERQQQLTSMWGRTGAGGRELCNRWILGSFRSPVSSWQIARALAGGDPAIAVDVEERLSALQTIDAGAFEELRRLGTQVDLAANSPMGQFHETMPLAMPLTMLGSPGEWIVEWKWPGCRVQIVRTASKVMIIPVRETELDSLSPELMSWLHLLPEDSVLEGVLQTEDPFEKHAASRRSTRNPSDRPSCQFIAFDVLRLSGVDLDRWPLLERRAKLEQLLSEIGEMQSPAGRGEHRDLFSKSESSRAGKSLVRISPELAIETWGACVAWHERARCEKACGLVLKRRNQKYMAHEIESPWLIWKCAPFKVAAVLMYVRMARGFGQVSEVELTFGVWQAGELVPVARTAPVPDAAAMKVIMEFVKHHTRDQFGPVRRVDPQLVVELEFDSISQSARNRSGVQLHGIRAVAMLPDTLAAAAESLETIQQLMTPAG